ncbi:hypothetical protein ZHAS_00019644 [Anopheles sinensis]|uniref:Uncharacterized protein n=1 Tax=Anopheles sinensis TaxID=74873 RepID=A0A084WMY0_ANOSI|nr:hypothetical protein ZHAS_00019644 [Anopheles sinensis]
MLLFKTDGYGDCNLFASTNLPERKDPAPTLAHSAAGRTEIRAPERAPSVQYTSRGPKFARTILHHVRHRMENAGWSV